MPRPRTGLTGVQKNAVLRPHQADRLAQLIAESDDVANYNQLVRLVADKMTPADVKKLAAR